MKTQAFVLSYLAASLFTNMAAQDKKHPNIIFLIADDLGYGDLSYLNEKGKIKTPHLDKMAREGVVCSDAHSSAAVSTPTRYGVLTGRYNWRSTLKAGVLSWYDNPLISSGRTTMASMLRNQGYSTACIGKWHLGMNFPTKDGKKPVDTPETYNLDFTKEITGGPCDVGFDYFFGVDAPNYPPYCYIENRHTLGLPDTYYPTNQKMGCRPGRGLAEWNLKDILPVLSDKAIEYIDISSKSNKPFFLYFPLTSPHEPIVPISKFEGQSKLNKYADFVMQTDAIVGSILEALEKNNILDNTIIVFTSDNGCSPRADFELLGQKGHDPSYIFRGMKSDLFEGGHHIPCIVHWPAQIKSHLVHQTVCLTDFMATFAAITGYSLADNEGEDSFNILPLLTIPEYKAPIREAIVHHSIDGSFAIRQDKWKLLLSSYSGGWSEPRKPLEGTPEYQLYDLEKDPGETCNLYEANQEVGRGLRELLIRYIEEGRSTSGLPQKNDGTYPWKQLSWMDSKNR